MGKLTKWKSFRTNKRLYRANNKISVSDLAWKLGQLEDVEQELGIDLITLFKALKNGIYFKVGDEIYFTDNLDLDFDEKCLFELDDFGDYEMYELKEYGETWALTKEELEK